METAALGISWSPIARSTLAGYANETAEHMRIEFDSLAFQEGSSFIAYCPELDVSSCGADLDEARDNLPTAVRLFLEEAGKLGTLEGILQEAGCS